MRQDGGRQQTTDAHTSPSKFSLSCRFTGPKPLACLRRIASSCVMCVGDARLLDQPRSQTANKFERNGSAKQSPRHFAFASTYTYILGLTLQDTESFSILNQIEKSYCQQTNDKRKTNKYREQSESVGEGLIIVGVVFGLFSLRLQTAVHCRQ